MKLRYFSHSCFLVETNKHQKILFDPFLDDNPTSPVKSEEIEPHYIILTHAHSDHIGDTFKIAERTNAKIICVFDLASYLTSKKQLDAYGIGIGGAVDFEFGKVKFTIAHHGSSIYDGNYVGEAAGVLLTIDGKCIYHAGDTGLFYDMKLIGEMNSIDYMLVPIGGGYTMGVDDALKAVAFVIPKCVIPMHYNTFPGIEADPKEFVRMVKRMNTNAILMEYGQEIVID